MVEFDLQKTEFGTKTVLVNSNNSYIIKTLNMTRTNRQHFRLHLQNTNSTYFLPRLIPKTQPTSLKITTLQSTHRKKKLKIKLRRHRCIRETISAQELEKFAARMRTEPHKGAPSNPSISFGYKAFLRSFKALERLLKVYRGRRPY